MRSVPVYSAHATLTKLCRQYFVDVLSSFVTDAKFTRHELQEYVAPVCADEAAAAATNPASRALELAHGLAFRNGLGAPLLAAEHDPVDVEAIKAYASSVFTKGNIAVLGTGISQEALSTLVEKSLTTLPTAAAAPTSASSKYFGGETRVEGHGGPETVFIGFGTTGASAAELAVLAAHLSPAPSVKWSQGLSPIAAALPVGASVETVLLPYSDATLFGFVVQGATAADVKTAGAAAVKALQGATSVGAEDLKKAVAKARFAAAAAVDGKQGLVSVLGGKVRGSVGQWECAAYARLLFRSWRDPPRPSSLRWLRSTASARRLSPTYARSLVCLTQC